MHTYPWHTRACLTALCAMLTLPFLNPHHFNPIPSFYPEWTAAACALLAATLLLRAELFRQIVLPPIALLPLGFVALTLLQLLLGRAASATQALLVLLYLLWALLLLILGRGLRDEFGLERLALPCAVALFAGALCAALLLGLQLIDPALGLGLVFPFVKGGGNLGQANHLANYLWLGNISAIYLYSRRRMGMPFFALASTVLLSAAGLTGSRSVFLYAAGAALVALWAARDTPDRALRRGALATLTLLPLTIALQLAFTHLELGNALQTSISGERMFREISGTSVRLQLWHTAWAIFTEHPLLGSGIGHFPYAAFLLAGENPTAYLGGGEHAHNIVMHLLAEYGIGGALLAVGMGLAWWLTFTRQTWTTERLWLATILLVLGVHSQLEYPLWYTFFLGIAALLLGAGSRGGWRPQLSALSRLLLAAMLLLGTITLSTLGRDYRTLEHALNQRQSAPGSPPDWRTTLDTLADLHKNSLFAHYVELSYAYQLSVDRDALKDKIVVCEHALRLAPVDLVAFKLAYLLALDGRTEDALTALRRAQASHPGFVPTARRQLDALILDYPELNALREVLNR